MTKINYYISMISDWNLWLHIWDNKDRVIENRKKLALKLWFKLKDFIFMNQVHCSEIQIVEEADKWKWTLDFKDTYECDALITKKEWVVLGVLVADCVPVIIYDEIWNSISVIHAWRKSTSQKIVAKTINKFLSLWSKTQDLKVIIWPSIWKKSYEVWLEVASNFRKDVREWVSKDKELLDLKLENKLQAVDAWVNIEKIEVIEIDTFTNEEYYSARRDWFWKWRFWAFIWINKNNEIK